MFNDIMWPRIGSDATLWLPIIEAWRDLPDDEEEVQLSDIVPIGFSDAALALAQQPRAAS